MHFKNKDNQRNNLTCILIRKWRKLIAINILYPVCLVDATFENKLEKIDGKSNWVLFNFEYAFVIARFPVQCDQYFPSFSYFADSFHEPLGKWNKSKICETRTENIGHTVRDKRAITNLSLTFIKRKKHNNKFLSLINH